MTIYKYFADKDSLYCEIGKQILSQCMLRLERIVSSKEALTSRLYTYLNAICDFTNSGHLELCKELAKYSSAIEAGYELYLQTYKRSLLTLIDEGIRSGIIIGRWTGITVFHYIDMGVAYYQQNLAYRNRMLKDSVFQRSFMFFYISHIFVDGENAGVRFLR
jgi:AcrR family transcriptional regulator